LRSALNANSIDRVEAAGVLRHIAKETAREPVDGSAMQIEDHGGRPLHMCPWHTCQGTRFSPDA